MHMHRSAIVPSPLSSSLRHWTGVVCVAWTPRLPAPSPEMKEWVCGTRVLRACLALRWFLFSEGNQNRPDMASSVPELLTSTTPGYRRTGARFGLQVGRLMAWACRYEGTHRETVYNDWAGAQHDMVSGRRTIASSYQAVKDTWYRLGKWESGAESAAHPLPPYCT